MLLLLQHPLVQAAQLQGCVILLVGVLGWTCSGFRRRREAHRLSEAGYEEAVAAAGYLAAQQPATGEAVGPAAIASVSTNIGGGLSSCATSRNSSASGGLAGNHHQGCHQLQMRAHAAGQPPGQQSHLQMSPGQHSPARVFKSHTLQQAWSGCQVAAWPPLAVVCPVKGCRPHSIDNWNSQLAAAYGGPHLIMFVVETATDPAVYALRQLMTSTLHHDKQQQQQQQQQHGMCMHESPPVGRVLDVWWQQQHQSQRSAAASTGCLVLLVEAGKATKCSQKIHNILAGITVALPALKKQQQQQQHVAAATPDDPDWSASPAAASPGYVCILDDDVALHPLSLSQLVDELEYDQTLFMATGYPFDIVATPPPGSNSSWWSRLLVHAAASYHLPLLIGFSISDRGNFVWGGAVLLRAAYLEQMPQAACPSAAAAQAAAPPAQAAEAAAAAALAASAAGAIHEPHIMQVWAEGGYSDDLLLAGYCAASQKHIGLPASAIFPQLLPATYSIPQYWNYLRRQLFVLDTYYSSHNKTINHTMMVAHSYGSAVFTGAMAATALQLLALLGRLLLLCCCQVLLLLPSLLQQWFEGSIGNHSTSAMAAALSPLLRWSKSCSSSSSSDGLSAGYASWAAALCSSETCCCLSGDTPVAVAAGGSAAECLWQLLSSCCSNSTWMFVGCVLMAQAAMGFMFRQVFVLFRVLSPAAGSEVLRPRVSWLLLWAGWLLSNAVLPWCMLYTFVCDQIEWGGIVYHKQGGRIVKVVHPAPSSAAAPSAAAAAD